MGKSGSPPRPVRSRLVSRKGADWRIASQISISMIEMKISLILLLLLFLL